ncbi:Rz-like lysis system protein LysB [Aeromonas hydrophila]|uniref:Rz-like lysis system protein LysB n=1 Tax=Aeromonas hydrophila TaxID=644 RepID=UPI001FF5018B|nr:Rz-like lysis system protein LysB [Aeromonas hydrophila]MCK0185441.1 Rz-like lysis system protein LysB [Aeromonas hydrophila]UOV92676.1 Rz-like lysis system protein LysB [Aeromonas hydrophila]
MWRNLLRSPITWLLLALVVTMGGWGWSAHSAAKAEGQVTTLQSDLKAADDKAKEAALRERAKDSTIDTLTEQLTAQATAAQQLQGQLDQLAMTAATREQTIARLKRENAELKSWADSHLPAAVVGLLQRPALTGAADYQAHLSRSGPMPAAAIGSAQ